MVAYGTVVDIGIDVDIKKRAGGTYKGYRLSYKAPDGQIKTIEKAMQSLSFYPAVNDTLRQLAVGDEFTVSMEKNDAGFWDVKALSKGAFVSETNPSPIAQEGKPSETTGRKSSVGTKVTSTYETPEERKLKQRLIVRQSSFNQAVDFAADVMVLKRDEIFKLAEEIEAWVYRGLD